MPNTEELELSFIKKSSILTSGEMEAWIKHHLRDITVIWSCSGLGVRTMIERGEWRWIIEVVKKDRKKFEDEKIHWIITWGAMYNQIGLLENILEEEVKEKNRILKSSLENGMIRGHLGVAKWIVQKEKEINVEECCLEIWGELCEKAQWKIVGWVLFEWGSKNEQAIEKIRKSEVYRDSKSKFEEIARMELALQEKESLKENVKEVMTGKKEKRL